MSERDPVSNGRLEMERTEQVTPEQIAAVLRELLNRLQAEPEIRIDYSPLLAKLEPQAAPQRCVECDGVGWIPGRGPDGEPDGERCQACKAAPQRCVPQCAKDRLLLCSTCRQTWVTGTEPPECKGAPKPRRMMRGDHYHGQPHLNDENCAERGCQPVPDAPSTEMAWVCVEDQTSERVLSLPEGGYAYVRVLPLPSREELAQFVWDYADDIFSAEVPKEKVFDVIGAAIYRALGVGDGR